MAGRRVLVVDDEYSFAAFARMLLEDAGYGVLEAREGAEGLRLAAAEKPDAVLMDLRLPDMDGLEAIRRLKGDPATRSLPVVACSVDASRSNARASIEAGAASFLPKPLAPAALKDALDKLF